MYVVQPIMLKMGNHSRSVSSMLCQVCSGLFCTRSRWRTPGFWMDLKDVAY